MSAALGEFAALAQRLSAALAELSTLAAALQLPPLATREWHAVLQRKLQPQLGDDSFLVVAVTGGTNIGKSVVFNHLAGFRASASSPLASGTKHAVCLVPEGFAERHDLARLFPSFRLQPWHDAAQALADSDDHLLFWRTSPHVPPNLLLLDTPDVDSDAVVNWRRADAVRQCADVLIAVLTQQKYNDAAVKQFFRKAAAEDKAIVVVFNQCDLPDDEAYWPLWLQTFTAETAIAPLYVYLAPNDRKAAEAIALPFAERRWPVVEEPTESAAPLSLRLQDVFARFHFAEIKLRSLRGALALVVDDAAGVPTYLREISVRSGEFRSAAELLTAHELAEVDDWPAPPTAVVIGEVRHWWAAHREGWSATVHGVYDAVGQTLFTPLRRLRDWVQGPTAPPWADYRQREWDAVVRAVGKIYHKLEWLSELGNALLKARLEQLLKGTSRAELLRDLQAAHAEVDFAAELSEIVRTELQSFRSENPQLFQIFKRVDEATAAARPVLSVVLGVTGVGLPFGEAATHLASHGVMQAAMHVAGEVAAGTVAVTVGDTAISATTSSGAGYLQAKFHRLQAAFTGRRARWLAEQLERRLLGGLAAELQQAAQVGRSPAFQAVGEILRDWNRLLAADETTGAVR